MGADWERILGSLPKVKLTLKGFYEPPFRSNLVAAMERCRNNAEKQHSVVRFEAWMKAHMRLWIVFVDLYGPEPNQD